MRISQIFPKFYRIARLAQPKESTTDTEDTVKEAEGDSISIVICNYIYIFHVIRII